MARTVLLPMLAWAVFGTDPRPVWAQLDSGSAQDQLLAKRAAEADAYRKLAESIKGLQIKSDTHVKDFVVESDVIEGDLDAFIRGVRLGEATWHDDLSCEVPAEVTVAKLVSHLKDIHARHYRGDRIEGADFDHMRQTINKEVISVVGMGAPRSDLPPDLPEGVEELLTTVNLPPSSLPPLWRKIDAQERLSATRAARLDAMRRLLERIRGVRITSETRVKDFVTEWDTILANAAGYLVGFTEKGSPYYHSYEPIVEVTLEIPTEQVIETVKKIYSEHYRGDDVSETDIANLRHQIKRKTFEAVGMGVARTPEIFEVTEAHTWVSIPDWALTRVVATGEGTDPEIHTPQGKLRAARAAESDAKRRLVEQAMGLTVDGRTHLRDFVARHDDIASRLDGMLFGALVENTEWSNGAARVTVSVPGMAVWSLLQDEIRLDRHR